MPNSEDEREPFPELGGIHQGPEGEKNNIALVTSGWASGLFFCLCFIKFTSSIWLYLMWFISALDVPYPPPQRSYTDCSVGLASL